MKYLNKKFGRWTVLKKVESSTKHSKYLCACDCGTQKEVFIGSLKRGLSKSCGCYNREALSKNKHKHGMTNTIFYRKWTGMKTRCLNKNEKCYQNYGARGITVCKRWLDFLNFKEDMLDTYLKHVKKHGKKQTTLERIDNNKGYSKNNCKWASDFEQANNKRNNIKITFKGKKISIAELSKLTNVDYMLLYARIKRGWSVNMAIFPYKFVNQSLVIKTE